MTMVPKVSVLVPIFNVEGYLEECLDSIVKQTLRDIEIICINDGSTDGSLGIVEKYAAKDPRIVIVNKQNSGYGDSMNKGIEVAKGEYIGIVESDDWIEADAFERLYDIAKRNNVEVVKSNFFNYFTTPEKKALSGTITELVSSHEVGRVIDPSETLHIYLQRPAIWTGIYRKEFLDQNKIRFLPTPGASYQDTGFNFKVWSTAKRVYFTDEAFLHYRQDNEASSINSPGKVFCVAEEFKEIKSYLKDNELLGVHGHRMRLARWGAYYWNIDRLTADLAEDFIRAASQEYREEYESGVFNFELCDANQTRDLQELIHNPEMMISRKWAAENAKVSIIVPVYNAEKYLTQCIEAILSQTFKDIEVIAIDDGSTDNSSDILEHYFRRDSRIRLINQYNQGQSVARNRGVEVSHAEFIAFSDGDDYLELDAIENLYETIVKEESDIAVGSIRVVYEDKRFNAMDRNHDRQYYMVKARGTQPVTDEILGKIDVSPCNKIFRKTIISSYDIKFPVGLRYEDAFFFYAYGWSSRTISFLPPEKYVYNYVRRSGSTMAQTFGGVTFAYDHIEIVILLFDFLTKNDLFRDHADYYSEMFVSYFNLSLRHMPENQRYKLYARVNRFIRENYQFFDDSGIDIKSQLRGKIPRVAGVYEVESRLKNVAKKIGKKMLPKVSLAYRAQGNILTSLTDLHHKVDRLELNTEERLSQLSSEVESHLIEK